MDVAAQVGTSQPPPNHAIKSEAQDEYLSQNYPTSLSPEDLRREAAPEKPTEQDVKNVVQLLTRIVAGQGERQEGLVVGTMSRPEPTPWGGLELGNYF